MTSKDELRLQVGQKLHDYGVRGQDNDYLTDYILNLLEGEAESYYKKGYQDAEKDCTAIWTAKLAQPHNKEKGKE